MIKYLRRALNRCRARRWAKQFGPPVISTPWLKPTPWDAWKLDDGALDALRHSVDLIGRRLAADIQVAARTGTLWKAIGGPAGIVNRRDYRERMDRLAVTAGTRLARNSPEGIAIMRATIAASPYQQCRKAHGCGHPCSCPKRNTTTVRKQP